MKVAEEDPATGELRDPGLWMYVDAVWTPVGANDAEAIIHVAELPTTDIKETVFYETDSDEEVIARYSLSTGHVASGHYINDYGYFEPEHVPPVALS